MKLASTLQKAVDLIKAELRGLSVEVVKICTTFLEKVLSLQSLTMSLRYPPLPRLFEYSLDCAFGLLDLFEVTFPRILTLVAASIIIDNIDLKAPNGVMELKKVAMFPVKVIVDYGIREVQGGLPKDWQVFKYIERWTKLASFIKAPGIFKGLKLIFQSFWGRIVRLILTIIKCAELFGLLACLWRYSSLLGDTAKEQMLFSAKLSQKHPRRRERARIYRRVGGVHP